MKGGGVRDDPVVIMQLWDKLDKCRGGALNERQSRVYERELIEARGSSLHVMVDGR